MVFFPEDAWNLIKEFCISKEAKWLYAMRNADVDGLRNFLRTLTKYENVFEINKLKKQLIHHIRENLEYTNLLKGGIQLGISNYLKHLRHGEKVLVFHMDTANDTESFECYRKGVVRKLNPLEIELYNFDLIIQDPRDVDIMVWLDTFDKKIIISKEETFRIKQKGFLYQMNTLSRSHIPKVFDDEFESGKRKFYGFKT